MAIVIEGAGSVAGSAGHGMATGSAFAVPFSQGLGPGNVLACSCLMVHGRVVTAAGAVIIMGAVFLTHHAGLHPDTGVKIFILVGLPEGLGLKGFVHLGASF